MEDEIGHFELNASRVQAIHLSVQPIPLEFAGIGPFALQFHGRSPAHTHPERQQKGGRRQ